MLTPARRVDPKFNNVLVFADLMNQATDSPVLSLLFTQGRHRNASVILLLQICFPNEIQHRYQQECSAHDPLS